MTVASVQTIVPETPSLNKIPALAEEHFASQGKVLSLSYGAPAAIGMYATMDRHPVLKSELSEEVWEALKAAGFRETVDGAVGRIDCLLYSQDKTVRDLRRAQEHAHFQAMQDGNRQWAGEARESLRRETGGVVDLHQGGVPHHIEKRRAKE